MAPTGYRGWRERLPPPPVGNHRSWPHRRLPGRSCPIVRGSISSSSKPNFHRARLRVTLLATMVTPRLMTHRGNPIGDTISAHSCLPGRRATCSKPRSGICECGFGDCFERTLYLRLYQPQRRLGVHQVEPGTPSGPLDILDHHGEQVCPSDVLGKVGRFSLNGTHHKYLRILHLEILIMLIADFLN